MTNLSSGSRSPGRAALMVFITVAVCLPAVSETEAISVSRNVVDVGKMIDRNEMDRSDDSEGDGYGYDDDDYEHSHWKRNDDKIDSEKTDKIKSSSKEELGEKIDKQDSKNVEGNAALVGGEKQEAKLSDEKSNVAVEESKPKADVQSDEEKPNNKNDKVRINDGEAKKQSKTLAGNQKVQQEKNKESANVKSDKSDKVEEENKISSGSAEKGSAADKSTAEAKENPKEDKAGLDRKTSETLNKKAELKAELKAESKDFRENRQRIKEDLPDRSHVVRIRPGEREKPDSDDSGDSGSLKLAEARREENVQEEEEKRNFKEESPKESSYDEEEDKLEAGEDSEKLQASNRENYDSLASEDLSNENDDFRDKNTDDSSRFNFPVVKLEDTDYHKNFIKSLNRLKNKHYAIQEEQDLDRAILRNLASGYDDPKIGRKRTRSRQITRSKLGNPRSYDLKEISRLRSKFLDVLKEQEEAEANRAPQNRKRKSPKTLEFKIQIIDQNEAKTKNSVARSLRQKKKIRFGQGFEYDYPGKSKSFHVGKKRLISEFETVADKGKRDEEIVYAPSKTSYDEVDDDHKTLVLVKKKQNGEKLTKTFVDGAAVKCLEDDLSSEDLAKILAQKKEYVVLKKVPSKNEYKVYGETETGDKYQAKEIERNEEMARPERKQKIKYVSVDENDLGTSEDAETAQTSQIRTKGFKSIEKKPKIQEEPSGLGDLFKEEEEKKNERPANEDPRNPGNENEAEKEIIYLDEHPANAAKQKTSKEEDGTKISEEKDFRASVVKQTESNREKAQRIQDKNQGKEVIIYNGGYGMRKPFADFKNPEKMASFNFRYRGPQYDGKYPQKYMVYNDNLEPKHQIKIIKNDGIIPNDRIIEMDRRIQSQKNHQQGSKNLDHPSPKNRFVDKETGAVYTVVRPAGSQKSSLTDADSRKNYETAKATFKRNSNTETLLNKDEISDNFQRFLKDFQELTETGSGTHRDQTRASDRAAVSGNQIRELKSYGDANLENLNDLLEDLLNSQSEISSGNEGGKTGTKRRAYKQKENPADLYNIYDKMQKSREFFKKDETEPFRSERRNSILNREADPDETDENEMTERLIKKREGPHLRSDVAPAETEETVLETQIQQILKNIKNNKNNEGKARKRREIDYGDVKRVFGSSRKLLSFEPKSLEKNIDPSILELFRTPSLAKGERKESEFESFIRKREIDIDESVPNRLNELLETSFAGTGNEKREVVKKDQPVWESNNNNDFSSGQIVDDSSNRDVDSESVLEKRNVFGGDPQEDEVSLETDKVGFYDSDMMPSNEWKRGNDRLVGGREEIARNKLKRSDEPPQKSHRETSVLKSKKAKKPEKFTIDKRTFEDMIKKYIESGQLADNKEDRNQASGNSDATYQSRPRPSFFIPKPSFQTTIDFTKLDNDSKNKVKDGKIKILPAENLSPSSKGKSDNKLAFSDSGYKSDEKEVPSYVLQKNDQAEEDKPSKESSLRDLAEIVRKLKSFFESKKLEEQQDRDSSKETDSGIPDGLKGKIEEPFGESPEEGQSRANKYLEFENDPELEFDQGEDEEEEQAENSENETVETQQAESAPSLDENELSSKWSTFSNVYPKDNRKSFKSGKQNGLGSEPEKPAYFKDRRKQEILFDQYQDLGSDANTIGFANENSKFSDKKFKSNLDRFNSDEIEEKGKDKKINKWQGFREGNTFFTGKEKRGFLSKDKATQGIHRHYPKNNRINNYEVRKVGNTLDTGSMKRRAAKSKQEERARETQHSEDEAADEELDDDVIQNIIGGYILRKSTKIRPEQGFNSARFSGGKSKMSADEKRQKFRSTDPECSDESTSFEEAKRTAKRLSPGRMTEVRFRKFHRKNPARKRGAGDLDFEKDQEDSFGETSPYQRSWDTADAEKSRSDKTSDKSGNNIRITITSEEEDDGNRGVKENRRKRYETVSREAVEQGFERVLSDPKSVERQTWSKSRSAFDDSAAASPDGPLKVDLNGKIPWVQKKARKFLREDSKREEPEMETYVLLDKKKRSVGPEKSPSLAVSNHLDKLPITNRALPVKTQSFFAPEPQIKNTLVNKNPFDSGKSEKADETTCPHQEGVTGISACCRSEKANTPSSEESTRKIGEQIIDCILCKVESNTRFKETLGPGLLCQKREKCNRKEEGTCSVSNKPISKKIRPLLKKLVVDLERVVEEDEKRRSCVKIDKETSQFLRSMVEKSDASNVEPFHNQNKFHLDSLIIKPEDLAPKTSKDSASLNIEKPNENVAAKKEYLLRKLIQEYQRLTPPEKSKAEPIYAYLRGQLSDGNRVSNPIGEKKSLVLSEPQSIKNQKSGPAEKNHFKGMVAQNTAHSSKINNLHQLYFKNEQSRAPAGNQYYEQQKSAPKLKPAGIVLREPTAVGYSVRTGNRSPALKKNFHHASKTGYRADRKEKLRPAGTELHKLGIGDAAALQLTLGQKPWSSNLDLAKNAKSQNVKIENRRPSQEKSR